MDLYCPICWFVTSDNRGPFNNSSCKVGSTFSYEVLELRLGVLWEQTCSILGMCSVFSLLPDCKLCQDSNHSVFISAFQESSAMLATQKVLDKRVQMVSINPISQSWYFSFHRKSTSALYLHPTLRPCKGERSFGFCLRLKQTITQNRGEALRPELFCFCHLGFLHFFQLIIGVQ